MRVGVIFPQTEIGSDPSGVREFAQATEELGYDHLIAYDHVLGANPVSRPGWNPPYNYRHEFHELFVLFGYLAALTQRIELVAGVVILPQRQTALVAKQAAAIDVFSQGRLRLGIGIGWNPVEYEALGENFHNRGLRSEEQVEVLRLLWTRELVTYEGQWHRVTDAGINPLPVQKPIPIWFGGSAEPVLERVARLGDGWFPLNPPTEKCRAMIEKIRTYARESGRDPTSIGIEGRIIYADSTPDQWAKAIERWRDFGATHVCLNTMKAGLSGPVAHVEALRRFKEALGGIKF